MNDDRRLIEDYLPIQAISKEASREKSIRKGHISTLHLWWARRPLALHDHRTDVPYLLGEPRSRQQASRAGSASPRPRPSICTP